MREHRLHQRHGPERELLLSGYRYALSLTHHAQDAEDLVQQACLKVFRVKGRLKDKAYLMTTVRNLFFDACRRRKTLQFGEFHGEALSDSSPNQTRVVDGRLDTATLLATLSAEEREVLYLNGVESFTAEEIGSITGKPRGSILSQLSRAKQKIRKRQPAESFSEEAV